MLCQFLDQAKIKLNISLADKQQLHTNHGLIRSDWCFAATPRPYAIIELLEGIGESSKLNKSINSSISSQYPLRDFSLTKY